MKLIYRTASLALVAITLQSCIATKKYERPEITIEENFRTENIATDSLSMASLPWNEVFTDSKLQEYITYGLDNNMDIRTAIQNIEAAEAYATQGKMGYYPTLNIGANYTHSVNSINTQFGRILGQRQRLDQFDITANLGWEADIWGKITSQKNALKASFLQSVTAHQAVKTQLISSIATSYYQLLALDEQKKFTEETIINRTNSLATNMALKEAGVVTEVAVRQTEAQLINAKGLLLDIENNIKLQENILCLLLGDMPHAIERSTLAEQNLSIDPKIGVPAQLLANRPDVAAAEFAVMNAFEMTNVARAAFYPTLRITAAGGLQSVDASKLFDPTSFFANIVGGLAAPIFNRGQIRTDYKVSQTNQEKALINYQKAIYTASKEVSDALYTYEAMDKKIVLKEQEAANYLKAVEYSTELLNNGMASYIEVLTANESALNAQLSIATTKYTKLAAAVQLYKALGGGVQ
ncbi:efflux transporter outer membrane subunit [Paenimyroides tangerinum]|uniref:Efflux transporter outer membrane subunit n=1 Tax=Paenimyroides tangerinum TaxID=2488728 RepID=A0A3P3WAU6_9FLAO|nr:efflux transporter outer membrane subunit [Paenimyroides tangerinum]RRJ92291.1 efflux transporter outer membrane subunit [Paenimyroides tangerinum]